MYRVNADVFGTVYFSWSGCIFLSVYNKCYTAATQ